MNIERCKLWGNDSKLACNFEDVSLQTTSGCKYLYIERWYVSHIKFISHEDLRILSLQIVA